MADWTIIVSALDETWSARKTVETILADNGDAVATILFATAPHTTPACRAVISELKNEYPHCVREHEQSRLPGLGGAIRECLEQVQTAWVVVMAADLETPPETLKEMITTAQASGVDAVVTSRWMSGGSLGNYNKIKLVLNWIFQKVFAVLFATRLTDMTYGYRAHRTELLTRYRWRSTGHAIFMETICVLLRAKCRVVEIPVRWVRRQEGRSHIRTREFLRYFWVGIKARFLPLTHWSKPQ